jgi:hypothetical protein
MIDAHALRPCTRCGSPLEPWSRADRLTCTTRCRVASWRAMTARRRPIPAPGDQGAIPAATDPHRAR